MKKVLLLGRAKSGKITTLHSAFFLFDADFQLTFAPSQFHKERSVWRYVIQLNLIQSVRVILDVPNAEINPTLLLILFALTLSRCVFPSHLTAIAVFILEPSAAIDN